MRLYSKWWSWPARRLDHVGVTISADRHAPEMASMMVDPDLLKQAALNIVVNAIRAMPKAVSCSFRIVDRGRDVEIRISDSGSGISPEKRDKIFQLYYTTKNKGSGIGLAVAPSCAVAQW